MIIETENYLIYSGGLEVFNQLQAFLFDRSYSCIFILIDQNTKKFCLPKILQYLDQTAETILIKAGEEYKTLETCSFIWEKLSSAKADRKSLLINLGGGVITDMGGFCASTYKRGIDFINIPTTVLSQVDASVGGKLGIDFQGLKNQIGLFVDPKAIFLCNDFINTLPEREKISGFAEIIKHALILDKDYWNQVKNFSDFSKSDFLSIINKSIMIKKEIVTLDPEEKNIRKKLNFGHTIGHAIESLSLKNDINSLTHGESIAIGMICESFISYKINKLAENDLKEISHFIFSIYKKFNLNPENYVYYLDLMKNDKKNHNKQINFTLLNKIGESDINKYADSDLIYQSFEYYSNFKY